MKMADSINDLVHIVLYKKSQLLLPLLVSVEFNNDCYFNSLPRYLKYLAYRKSKLND